MQIVKYNWENFKLIITNHAKIRLNERNISISNLQEVLISYQKIFEKDWKKIVEK